MSEHKVWIGLEVFGGRICCIRKDSVGVETSEGIKYYKHHEVEAKINEG